MNKNILLIAIITCVNSTYGAIFTLNNQSADPIWVRINAEKPPVFKKISAKTSRKFDSGKESFPAYYCEAERGVL